MHSRNALTLLAGIGILIAIGISPGASAQMTFERNYDNGSGSNEGRSVRPTLNGGYIIAGYTTAHTAGDRDFYLVETDSLGNVLWTKTYGGSDRDYAKEVDPTTDGGYVAIGGTQSFGGYGWNFWLIRTDALGDTLWTKAYDSGSQEWGNSVKQTADGGYILAGRYNTFGLIKTDPLGNVVWSRSYNCGYYAEAYCVQQTPDGGYIAAGEVVINNVDQQLYLVKTDAVGDTLWTTISGSGSSAEIGRSVCQTSDGGYIAAGLRVVFMGACSAYLVRTDSLGNILWTRTHNFGSNTDEALEIQQTTDGGYIFTGFTNGHEAPGDVLLAKTDALGSVVWTTICGRSGIKDKAFSVRQTTSSDDGFIVAGYTGYTSYAGDHVYLIKTDSLGAFTPVVYVSIPDTTYGGIGDIVTIPVNTEEITHYGIGSAEFALTFNPLILAGIDLDATGTLLAGTDWSWEYNVVGGTFSVMMSGTDTLAANGTLINLRFAVLSDSVAGGISPLHFTDFVFNDGTPEAFTDDGAFVVLGGAIEGVITEARRGPIANAIVTVENGFSYSDTTNAAGYYSISELAPDTYSMHVAAFGYNDFDTTGVVVLAGETTVVDVSLLHPEIGVAPEYFDVTVFKDSVLDTVLYITNDGNGPLEFRIRATDGSGGGTPGSVIEWHPCVGSPTGFAWDGTHFWQSNTDDQVVKLDSAFNVLDIYPALGTGANIYVRGLLWHDGYLYQAEYFSGCIYKVDVSQGYVPVDTIHVGVAGFAWVGNHPWHSNGNYQASTIYECDSLWNTIESWLAPAGGMRGMSYNPYLDSLYICSGVWWDNLYSIDPHTGNIVEGFRTPGSHLSGEDKCVASCYDSRYPAYIWLAHQYDSRIYLTDTGNEVVGWLPLEPVCGEVHAGETMPVALHFDARMLAADSVYTATVEIRNSSADSLVCIPISMHVLPGGMDIEEECIPMVFGLRQSVPNPALTGASIRYQLPRQCRVSLKIYDVSGALVRTVVNENKPAGYYTFSWDGRDDKDRPLTSGIYFYELRAGEYRSSRKMVLAR
ncbi:MAG: carboxypeptidase regulatory-like domain-containing protein [Candidatus Eisenbacteria sp.]|nr:carboxypeptidase regulatory-like domain-containing protein [Candidatus Eisenbacteria bacterium]